MFRVSGGDYYRFSWNAQHGYQRLVKSVNGVFTLLDERTEGFALHTAHQVEISAVGSQLEVKINGVVTLSAADAELAGGSVALYTWAQAGASFDNVRVVSE